MDLFSANGTVPAAQLRNLVDQLRLCPPHPGRIIRNQCLGDRLTIRDAARKLDVEPASLEAVLDCKADVSPDLAARLEGIGWSTADVWIDLQADYNLAQARRRRGREASAAA